MDNAAERDDKAFAELREHYSDAEIAELTLTSDLLSMWNRFSRALRIELYPAEESKLATCLAFGRPN